MDLTIIPATDDLYVHYDGQLGGPQPAFLQLSLRTGHLSAGVEYSIGSVPTDAWNNVLVRWYVPPIQASTANALMAEIADDVRVVLAGGAVEFDGSNHVGRLDAAAEEISERIAERLNEEVDTDIHYVDATDWLHDSKSEIVDKMRDGATDDALYDEYQGDGHDEETPIVEGLMNYLRWLREESSEGWVMTIPQIVEEYNLTQHYGTLLRRIAGTERLPARKSGKSWLIKRSDIERWLREKPAPGRKPNA